jgi:hypothetical protein
MTNIRNNYVLKKTVVSINIFVTETLMLYNVIYVYIYWPCVSRSFSYMKTVLLFTVFFEYNVIMFVSYFVHKRNHVLNQFSLGNLMSQN